MRALATVLFVLLGWVLPAVAAETGAGDAATAPLTSCVCEGQEATPPGDEIHLNVKNDMMEISAAQGAWVRHGVSAVLVERTEGLGATELCHFLCSHLLFDLAVDGRRLAPDSIVVSQWHPEDLPRGVWLIEWYWLFPSGYFAPGVHCLEGRWSITELPCEYSLQGCESLLVPDSLFTIVQPNTSAGGVISGVVAHILTLSVLYP